MRQSTYLAVTSILSATASAVPFSRRQNATKPDLVPGMIYSFADITPSIELAWVDCFESFKCTSLTVPLDYADPDAGTTDVAFIKTTFAGEYAQDILYNPGGPGGPGVDSLLSNAERFKERFGSTYNWVSFDPRGVNNTGPLLSCSRTPEERETAALKALNPNAPLAEIWATSKAQGVYCSALNAETNAKYAGTSAVVQDMVHFTELQAAASGKAPEDANVWFYGVSYGTILGQALATMFPDRLGRIILDGNVNAAEYYQDLVHSSVDSTDDSFGFFFRLCYEAGPKFCAFAGNASSPADLELRFQRLLQRLEEEPLPLTGRPDVVTKWSLLSSAFNQMYSPMRQFDLFATMLQELDQGNTTTWVQALGGPMVDARPLSQVQNYTQAAFNNAFKIIWSIDSAGRYALKNFSDYKLAVDVLKSRSLYGWQAIATDNAIIANGMNITPPASQFYEGPKITQTNVPILFIGNKGDPITPLSSAFHNSAYFPGSAVLSFDAPGHGSMGTPSSCMQNATAAYLADGTLPEKGTVCEMDVKAEAFFGGEGSRKP